MIWQEGFKFWERKLDAGWKAEETELEDVNNKTQRAVDKGYFCDENVRNKVFMSEWFILLCFILTSHSSPGVLRCVFPSWGRDSDHGDSPWGRCMRSLKPFFHYLWILTRTFTVSIVFRVRGQVRLKLYTRRYYIVCGCRSDVLMLTPRWYRETVPPQAESCVECYIKQP